MMVMVSRQRRTETEAGRVVWLELAKNAQERERSRRQSASKQQVKETGTSKERG